MMGPLLSRVSLIAASFSGEVILLPSATQLSASLRKRVFIAARNHEELCSRTTAFTCQAGCTERGVSKNRNAGPVKCNALLAPVSLQDFGLVVLQITLEQWPTSAVYGIQFAIQPRPKGDHIVRKPFHQIVALFPVLRHLRA